MLDAGGREAPLDAASLEATSAADGGSRPARAGPGAPFDDGRHGPRRRDNRRGPGLPRPGRHDRPAARARHERGAHLPRRGHRGEDDHRRPCRNGARDCRADRHRRGCRGGRGADRTRPGQPGRRRVAGGRRPRQCFRPGRTGTEAAPGARPAGRGRGGRDDRRRRERCPGAEAGRHRHRHGPERHRRGQGGRGDGADRRQLRHHRGGGRGRPRHLRQPGEVHHLDPADQFRRGPGDPRRHRRRRHAADHAAADPLDQHDHGRAARPAAGFRAGRTRHHAAAAAPARRRPCSTGC
jgi:hypothetical protein